MCAESNKSNASPIEHVFVLMLENHSFDQMLGDYQTVYPNLDGIDSAAPARTNVVAGKVYEQAPTTARSVSPDPKHELDHVLRQIQCEPFLQKRHTPLHQRFFRGLGAAFRAAASYFTPRSRKVTKMSAPAGYTGDFVANYAECYESSTDAQRREIMGYYERGTLPALHALADHFTICDHWFSSVPGPTWTNRFFVHTGTSRGIVRMPDHKWDLKNYDVYDQPTVYDRLNERNKDWRIYFHDVPQSLALTNQWKRENKERYRKMHHFEQDLRNADESFPAYVFIEPQYLEPDPNDDHPPYDIFAAQALIAKVYNAIRANERVWKQSLLVILYDEHGGFYDHVCPPVADAPDDNAPEEYDFKRLGVRVPALLVSPWVERGVFDETLDHTSLLRFVSDLWDLGPLGSRVKSANSFAPALKIADSPRDDTPSSIPSAIPAVGAVAMQAAGPKETTHANENQESLARLAKHLEEKANSENGQNAPVRTMSAAMPDSNSDVASQRVDRFLNIDE